MLLPLLLCSSVRSPSLRCQVSVSARWQVSVSAVFRCEASVPPGTETTRGLGWRVYPSDPMAPMSHPLSLRFLFDTMHLLISLRKPTELSTLLLLLLLLRLGVTYKGLRGWGLGL